MENWPSRRTFNILQLVPRNSRKNIGCAGIAGGPSRAHFAYRVHKAAVANRSKQKWQSKIEAKNTRAQIALGECNRMSRTKRNVVIHAATFAKRDFAFRAAIKIVEDGAGQAAFGDTAQIRDVDHARGRDGSGRLSHCEILLSRLTKTVDGITATDCAFSCQWPR